jgi:Zn finger protein HypA/HybF involved in hydrogenase expression
VEPKLGTKEVMVENTAAKEEEQQVQFLKPEIECPRCRDNMKLCSDFDNLDYVCDECGFSMYAREIKHHKHNQVIDRKSPRAFQPAQRQVFPDGSCCA